jgi:LCP family protein required for cell wall assembly
MITFKNKQKGIALACSALMIIAFAGTAFAFNMGENVLADEVSNASIDHFDSANITIPESAASVEDIPVLGNTDTITNIMLIGVDSRENNVIGRSDCMVLLTIHKKAKTIKLTSFTRDMYVSIPNYGYGKLNFAYMRGGYDLLNQTIEQNFRIDVDQYMKVDFQNFTAIVNAMDGVDIELTGDEAALVGTGTTAGIYHLNGEQTLIYSRMRSVGDSEGTTGVFGRDTRLCVALQALINTVKTKNISELASFMKMFLPSVSTNMSSNELSDYIVRSKTYLDYDISKNTVCDESEGDFLFVQNIGSALVLKDATQFVLNLQRLIYN